ncbi:MAG: energy-coupling factor ABC transporter ATP-binding protein [Kiritimatiellia bacterium]
MMIELENVVLDRPGKPAALHEMTHIFDSRRCRSVAVLGANGAGKSTLLEGILGLVPVRSGQIRVDGLCVEPKNFRAIRTKIGMVFQNADHQLFSHTVGEDISFGPGNLGLSSGEVVARVQEAMRTLGIAALASREINRLSGGEKRRVALAGVLAMKPEAILLDEPTAMLDPRACRELTETLHCISSFQLIATHDLAFATRVCEEAIVLRDGALIYAGDMQIPEAVMQEAGLV